jgi:hypothetical protein
MSPALSSPVPGAYAPSDLRSAYDLVAASENDGSGQTIAIVDADADPDLATDLSAYRSQYGLPACTTSSGCLQILNEHGGTSLSGIPTDSTDGWEFEQSLDVEMVSAICPNCNIVMFEANSDSTVDLGTAENAAATAGYKFISNSWSGLDSPGESYYDTAYFNHPGVVTAFASGDTGYSAAYPASSELVTAVGGTYLNDNGGTWTQTVWNNNAVDAGATGSGCSSGEPKPSWQIDTASGDCPNRTENDVSAAAAAPTGFSVYDSYGPASYCGGWCYGWGTSAATPIVTSVYALAGTPTPNTYPSQYPYMDSGAGLTKVTSGNNKFNANGTTYTCEPNRQYLCNAGDSLSGGYNGPTGWGTPNGANLSSFTDTDTTADVVSAINPGTYDLEAGYDYPLPAIQAYTTGSSQTFTYTASGLPSGMTIDSSTGAISGPLSNSGTSTVTVTVADTTGATTTIKFDIVAVASLTSNFHATTGAVPLALDGKCMDDTNGSSTNGNKVQIWGCSGGANQKWTYAPSPYPGGLGTLKHNGKCLAVSGGGIADGTKVELWTCNGTESQQWYIAGYGELLNGGSGTCLDDPSSSTTNGKQLDIHSCTVTSTGATTSNQAWTLPASPIQSGISGMCASDRNGSNANGTYIWLWACGGQSSQNWTISRSGSLQIEGKCLSVAGRGTTNGSLTELWTCASTSDQYWYMTGTGEIENNASEKCLASSGTGNGARLELEDCTGAPGEIWAQS